MRTLSPTISSVILFFVSDRRCRKVQGVKIILTSQITLRSVDGVHFRKQYSLAFHRIGFDGVTTALAIVVQFKPG